MGNTCKSMANSCQCMAKTTTILQSNQPPTNKNKWKKTKGPFKEGVTIFLADVKTLLQISFSSSGFCPVLYWNLFWPRFLLFSLLIRQVIPAPSFPDFRNWGQRPLPLHPPTPISMGSSSMFKCCVPQIFSQFLAHPAPYPCLLDHFHAEDLYSSHLQIETHPLPCVPCSGLHHVSPRSLTNTLNTSY